MDKSQDVYDFIMAEKEKNGYSPSVREICAHFNFKSSSTGKYYVDKLEKLGKISRNGGKSRTIELTDRATTNLTLPVLGEIAAGQPILAEQNVMDKFIVSENLFSGTNLFILKVKGDSMINVGIYNGDYVVISKQSIANNGEIVACLIDNEATVKRYYKENGFFRLQPENSFMQPIYTSQLEILGKVVGLIRNNF